jgi:hypothetical protein
VAGNNKSIDISYNSKARGQQLILVGLLLLSAPLVQKLALKSEYLYVDIICYIFAMVFIILGIWRVSQNVTYNFSIKGNLVKQQYSGNRGWNFTVNLREIKEIKQNKGGGNIPFYVIMEDSKRYPIPRIHDNNPTKVVRYLERCIGA